MADQNKDLMAGFGPLLGGCHGGLHPSLLPDSQYAAGLNIAVRGGFVRSRPGLRKLLDLGNVRFQGAALYRLNGGDRIICVANGTVYQIPLFQEHLEAIPYSVQNTVRTRSNGTETEVFSPDFGKDESGNWSDVVNLVKAERFFVVQDGYHQPVIIGENDDPNSARVSFQSETAYTGAPDGASSTSVLFSDVPVARAMAYASGRLLVSPRYLWEDLTGIYPDNPESGRMYLMASDLDGDPESCLRFVETNLAIGGAWRMPLEAGFVTALQTFRNSETIDGNGALLAFCQDGINAFNIAYEPGAWGAHKQTISQMLFAGIGTYSPRAVIPVNDDIWFRRVDGLGSVRYTTSQVAGAAGSLSSTPMSFEVAHRLDLDQFQDLPAVSASYADNRLLVTSCGRLGALGFRGLVSLDTAALYTMSERPTAAYDDIWTGLEFLQVLSGRYGGRDRHLIFARHNGTVGLWFVDPAARDDMGTPILSRLYTRQFDFGNPVYFKKFSKVELWIRDLVGTASIRLYWRADGNSLWTQASEVTVKAGTAGLPQSRRRLTFSPVSENPCDSTGRPTLSGTGFQFCVEWEGSLCLERGVFFATLERNFEPNMQCSEEEETVLEAGSASGVELNDFEYAIQ